ncbi:MAG: DegT/DnrJ/EryC1/StrS family aminotransferase [Proteobacteria bacterium]|nr:DegT/DnrJ/EryC1/StrS family aminotransferase [Pseudomonadota bacterium]
MQFIDLKAQFKSIEADVQQKINTVLEHGQFIMGPEINELEDQLAKYTGVKHAVSCSSGTDAILLALMALGAGPGDAIFTSPFTFIATAEVISLLGATPVFVDIDPLTYNIDPAKLEATIVKFKNTALTPRGIIAVDLFGLPADYDLINIIAKNHDLYVIEDGAQSFGADYHGKKSCSMADIACTSFFPAKPLGCFGDGGMCFTDDDNLAKVMQSLRVHGKGSHKYDNERIGINGRLDTLQAAILLSKFSIFPKELKKRENAAKQYTELFSSSRNQLSIPVTVNGYRSVWAQYSILAKDEAHRALIQSALKENDIPTAIYYPKPLHLQTAFKYLGYKEGDFPVSEDCSKRIFSIPMHPYLEWEDQKKIADIINQL